MQVFKKILLKLLFPPAFVVILLVPIAIALLIYAFVFEDADPIVSYLSYFISAYALTVVCARLPRIYKKLKTIKQDNKYLSLYFNDTHLRMKLSLYSSVAINFLYALLQLGLGFYHHSVWFYALAGYYAILGLMRYFLLKETRTDGIGKNLFMELLHYRFCGILLVLMNLTLGVITAYIVWQNRGFEHGEIVTIAMAAYTFFSVTVAIINVIKYRRYESPLMSAAKAISLAAALVSMLSLETSMLSAFGTQNEEQFRRIMTAATGAAVCLLVFAMAVYMIVRSTKQINRLKKEKNK